MSDETDLSDRDLAALAKEVAHRLERRGVLQAGTGAAAGGIAGYLATGRASAADTSAGNVGSAGNSADVFLDQLRDPGGDEVLDVDDTGDVVSQRGFQFPSVETETLSTEDRPVVDVTAFGAVGDGSTSDDAAIRDAFDHASTINAAAVLFPSTGNASGSSETPADTEYMMDPSDGMMIEPPEGMTVAGAGRDVALVHEDPAAGGTFFSVPEGNVGTTFRDFTVDMRGDVGGNGVCVKDKGQRTLIENLRLLDSAVLAVQFRGAQYSTIRGCEIRDVYVGNYIGMIGLRNGFGTCRGVRVLNNHIYMTTNPDKNQAGVGLSTAEESVIAFNDIHDVNSSGIRTEDQNGNTNRNLIAFNNIHDVDVRGIDMGPYEDPSEQFIVYNQIENTPRTGIKISHPNSVVRGNFIRNTGTDPDFEGPGINAAATNSIIAENTIYEVNPMGIQSAEPTSKIVNNYIDGMGNTDAHRGIISRGSTGAGHTIRGNYVARVQRNGIRVESGAEALVVDNYVEDAGIDTEVITSDRAAYKSSEGGTVFLNNAARGSGSNTLVASDGDVVVNNYLPNGIQSAALDRPSKMYGNVPRQISDVRTREAVEGNTGYHDGSGSNTVGPAFYDGTEWVSLVDGSGIT